MQQPLAIDRTGISEQQFQFAPFEKNLNGGLIIKTKIPGTHLNHPIDLRLGGIQRDGSTLPLMIPGREAGGTGIGIRLSYQGTFLRR